MDERKNKKERTQEKKLRTYFVRLFGWDDVRSEEQFHRYGKKLFFILLVLVEVLVLLQRIGVFLNGGDFGS